MDIFNHRDPHSSELDVYPDATGRGRHIHLQITSPGGGASAQLHPAAVNDLYAALGRWMAEEGITAQETSTPPADLNPIYDAIVKRLTDEWLPRVLPLHRAPQAATWAPTVFPTTSCHRSGNHGPESLCSDCVCDPEPQDVGHAEEPAGQGRCSDCGASWGSDGRYRAHAKGCGWRERELDAEEPADHGRLMSELQRAAVRSVACICTHSWADHHTLGCWVMGCECTRTRS